VCSQVVHHIVSCLTGLSIEFSSMISDHSWILTQIYAPCTTEGKQNFLDWFYSIDMQADTDWLVVGDFNLIRKPEDRNKPRGNLREMLDFNAAINRHDLEELRLNGAKFTWTNKQQSPLLERLDWFFASTTWMTNFPSSFALALSRDTSDHTPCLISISTSIPQARIFRFENYCMLHEDFPSVMSHGWNVATVQGDNAKNIIAKFKNLRRVLRAWHSQLSNLAATITNNKNVLMLLDTLEEFKDLSLEEWNFRAIVQEHLTNLLEQHRIYWKQRGQIKWAKLGDENTKIFHATATIRHNKNSIRSLLDEEGVAKLRHEDKALILWESFKERLGTSEFQQIHFDLSQLMEPIHNLEALESPFLIEEIDTIIKELPNGKSLGPYGFNSDFMKAC
jgi:hypothetical protein